MFCSERLQLRHKLLTGMTLAPVNVCSVTSFWSHTKNVKAKTRVVWVCYTHRFVSQCTVYTICGLIHWFTGKYVLFRIQRSLGTNPTCRSMKLIWIGKNYSWLFIIGSWGSTYLILTKIGNCYKSFSWSLLFFSLILLA